jgi:hypothetical protein
VEIICILIITHLIMRAAAQAGADQARTEVRRAGDAIRRDLGARRSAAAGRLRSRLDAGRDAGPVYPLWWAWAALRGGSAVRRAWRQNRRPAETQGGRPGTNRSTTGPFSRIFGAAWRGGAYAWADARRQRAASTGQGQPQGTGSRARPGGTGRPKAVPVGVCERCGAVVALAALADATTRHGRTAKMCAACRAAVAGERQGDADDARPQAGPVDDPVDAEVVDDPPGATPDPELNTWDENTGNWSGGTDQTGVTPGVRCIECGELLTGMVCSNPECRLCPGYRDRRGLPVATNPQQWALPVRFCGCGRQLMPGTWCAVDATNADICLWCAQDHREVACRPREPVELAAIGDPIDADGNRMALSPDDRAPLATEAARIALTAAQGTPNDSPPAEPAGTQDGSAAPAALPAPTPTGDDEDMTCANGEVHTQADWADQSAAITGQLAGITDSAENMLRCLTAKEASRSQMTTAAAWADQVQAAMGYGQDVIADVNARQDPYVDAVQGAGGSDEVARPDYYDEM